MAKRFDFSSEFEDNDIPTTNNDTSSYIDTSQDLEHTIAALHEVVDAVNKATAELKESNESMAEFNKQKKALQKLIKTFDEKIEAISKAATFKLTPEVHKKLNEIFHNHFVLLDQKLKAFVNQVDEKAHSIVDKINTKDSRIAMPRADFWLNRILNLIPMATLLRLLWIDTKTGITTDSLWTTCWWTFGIYFIIVIGYFIFRASREK